MNLTLLPYPVVKLPKRRAGLNHRDFLRDIDRDAAEVEEVDDDEGLIGDVRDSLVIMAAAADFELGSDGFGADDSDLDVRFYQGGDDE